MARGCGTNACHLENNWVLGLLATMTITLAIVMVSDGGACSGSAPRMLDADGKDKGMMGNQNDALAYCQNVLFLFYLSRSFEIGVSITKLLNQFDD